MGRSCERQKEEKIIVNRLPFYGRFDYARIGYFSLTTRTTKFISEEDSLTINGETETPGYFFGKFMKGIWCAKRKIEGDVFSYPYKAIPGKFPAGVYIDIRHAFKQIASSFGMEVFIQEGKFAAFGETLPTDECFQNKICRGLLVTGLKSTGNYQEWKENDLRTIRFSNPNYAPHLTYTIWASLHAIQTLVSPFSIYAHTDGFIVNRRHVKTVCGLLDSVGLDYTFKFSGSGEVYGVGNYRIGTHRTATTNHQYHTKVYIREDNYRWWLDYLTRGKALHNAIQKKDIFDRIREDEPDT